jgi:hypothetical protein
MSFTIRKLREFIFVNKNWSNDCKVGCKSPFNLLKLIGIYPNLEEELKQFGGVVERNEIMDLQTTKNIFKANFFVKKKNVKK